MDTMPYYYRMKLLILVLAATALTATATPIQQANNNILKTGENTIITENERSVLVNMLIRQLFELIRRIIVNGSGAFGMPPLDPLHLEHLKLSVPAGLINFDIEIENGFISGIGDFVVHKSHLDLRELSFDIEISVPVMAIKADRYNLLGDIYTALPIYGDGEANILVNNFKFYAKLFLKQSEDGESILIDRIEDTGFHLESLKANLTGVVGGGDVDAVANAIIDDIIPYYMNRFNRAIGHVASAAIIHIMNPFLNQLDSWKYIDLLL